MLGENNVNDYELRKILINSKAIATVGFSQDPKKPGYYVPQYMMDKGYHVIPVNPSFQEILGQKAYPDLLSIPEPVDIVQIFRPPAEVPAVVDQAIQKGARVIWMQIGAVNPEAAQKAIDAGLVVVTDLCMMIEHKRLVGK
jgi:predicted CoA-binding protein